MVTISSELPPPERIAEQTSRAALSKKILDILEGHDRLTLSSLFDLCGKTHGTGFEEYQFKPLVSAMIREGLFPGFRLKSGRNGGIVRLTEDEPIPICLSLEEVVWLKSFLLNVDDTTGKSVYNKLDFQNHQRKDK